LAHANHDTSVTRTTNNAGEHGTWGIVTSKSSLQIKQEYACYYFYFLDAESSLNPTSMIWAYVFPL
jgi:hypothetical protein